MKKNKFKDIQRKIDQFKDKSNNSVGISRVKANNSKIFDVATELVAGVIIGLMMGIFFDNLFDSKPLFLIICMIVAIIAAFRSIWKSSFN
jgi:F0F1-type ATP synthase assembly protein I